MRPAQSLPEDYQPTGTLDARRLINALLLTLGALILLTPAYGLFNRAAVWLSGGGYSGGLEGLTISGVWQVIQLVLVILLINAVMLVLHEGAHGIFLWAFTRARPVFALKAYYAYAAAPGWYFPRRHYLIVSVAPLVLLSLAGLALMPFFPLAWLPALVGFLTLNAAGSIGDLAVFFWLLFHPPGAYAYDTGDAVTFFTKGRGG